MERFEYSSFEDVHPYNYIAQLIRQLQNIDERAYMDRQYRESIEITPELRAEVDSFLKDHPVFGDGRRMMNRGVPESDAQELMNSDHYQNFPALLEILLFIERQLSCDAIIQSVYIKSKKKEGFFSLNTNTEETGIAIIPKVRTLNDDLDPEGREKKFAEQGESGINCELANLYYIVLEELEFQGKSCGMRHFFPRIDPRSWWENRKSLRIALAPLAYGNYLKVHEYSRPDEQGVVHNLFSVDGLKNEERLRCIIKADYVLACQKHADILIFPEMLGSEYIVSTTFRAELRQAAKDNGVSGSQPSLLLLPTVWSNGRNELYVSTPARLICRQNKQVPFSYCGKDGKSYREDLISSVPEICIVHISELGRLAFPICRDYLTDSYLNLLVTKIRATLLLCPSYSYGKTRFDLEATLPIRFGGYSAIINSCAVRKSSEDYLGIVTGPMPGDMHTVYLKPSCKEPCPANENACFFLAEICVGDATTITYEHFCSA